MVQEPSIHGNWNRTNNESNNNVTKESGQLGQWFMFVDVLRPFSGV